MKTTFLLILPALSLFFFLLTPGCSCGPARDRDGDTDIDGPGDMEVEESCDSAPEDELVAEPVDADEDMEEDIAADDAAEEDGDEWPVSGCGNFIVESGEVCDDGNRVTEFCGRGEDCLGDCSLLQAGCGNGVRDKGEECDDGNNESMDGCTKSCNANDHGVGAPCTCESECEDLYPNRGNIVGCEGLEVPAGSGGEIACMESVYEGISGYTAFYAEGYCTLLASECSGPDVACDELPQIGDMDTFACPAGSREILFEYFLAGVVTMTIKMCFKTCDSPAQCRWNAYDAYWRDCGRLDCVPVPDDSSVSVCADLRNFSFP